MFVRAALKVYADPNTMKATKIVTFTLMGLHALRAAAQCTLPVNVPSPSPTCTGTNLVSGNNNITLTSGTTYTYSGSTLLDLTGDKIQGTLLVCGNLELDNLNFSGAPSIVVEPGGTLTISAPSNAFKGSITNYGTLIVLDGSNQVTLDAQIANYGTMTFGDSGANSGTGIQGNSGGIELIYNGIGATFIVAGNSLNNAPITNQGQMYFNADLNQQTSSICETNDAVLTVADYNNDSNPGIALDAPGDQAGLIVTKILGGNSSNGTIANSSNVLLCENPGITIGSPYLPGSATVMTNCTSLSVLPLSLTSFTESVGVQTCTLQWSIAPSTPVLDFVVFATTDGKNFDSLLRLPAASGTLQYACEVPLAGPTWYRLRLDMAGEKQDYSALVLAEPVPVNAESFRVQPTAVTGNQLQIYGQFAHPVQGSWIVLDLRGRVVLEQAADIQPGRSTTLLVLPGLAPGTYELLLQGSEAWIRPAPFVLVRP